MKKGYVYCLVSKNKVDGVHLYKIGCTTNKDIKNRIYYWNSKIKTQFSEYKKIYSKDIYKDEKNILWKLHSHNLGLLNDNHFELFGDFNGDLSSIIDEIFNK